MTLWPHLESVTSTSSNRKSDTVDDYLFEEQSCHISSGSDLKRRSLKPCPHWRLYGRRIVAEFGDGHPKRRLSAKTASVAEFAIVTENGDCRRIRRLSPKTETVTENGDCRRIRPQIVAVFDDYSRQCGQGFRLFGERRRNNTTTRWVAIWGSSIWSKNRRAWARIFEEDRSWVSFPVA